jgi:hypothetical protein
VFARRHQDVGLVDGVTEVVGLGDVGPVGFTEGLPVSLGLGEAEPVLLVVSGVVPGVLGVGLGLVEGGGVVVVCLVLVGVGVGAGVLTTRRAYCVAAGGSGRTSRNSARTRTNAVLSTTVDLRSWWIASFMRYRKVARCPARSAD